MNLLDRLEKVKKVVDDNCTPLAKGFLGMCYVPTWARWLNAKEMGSAGDLTVVPSFFSIIGGAMYASAVHGGDAAGAVLIPVLVTNGLSCAYEVYRKRVVKKREKDFDDEGDNNPWAVKIPYKKLEVIR